MPVAPDLCGIALDGRYELLEPIGEGAFGRVYRGRDRRLQRTVAIKVIKPWWAEDPRWVAAFERETRLLARISDPGIVSIFDVGHAPEGLYCVSELVDGESLAELVERGPLAPAEATAIATRLCDALAGAHALSIVHRDVKPANVLLGHDGAVKLADFGVAKLAEGTTAGGTIGTGIVVGTPKYMAPEQGRGAQISAATDVYSVGVVLYEMLAGRPPFEAVSAVELAICHLQEPVGPLPDSVPGPLAAVIMRALAKDPLARWADGSAMAAALRQAADGRVPGGGDAPAADGRAAAGDPTVPQPLRAPRTIHDPAGRRRAVAIFAGVVAILAALVVASVLSSGGSSVKRVRVPSLVGRTVASARAQLSAHHLRVRVKDVPAPAATPGTVTAQRPAAGRRERTPATVDLTVAEVPKWRRVQTVVTERSGAFEIRGRRWRITASAANAEHCTLLVFCSHSDVEVRRLSADGQQTEVESFQLSDGAPQTHVLTTGPGRYTVQVDPASGDTSWSLAVDDYD